jgi:hypothetical protein
LSAGRTLGAAGAALVLLLGRARPALAQGYRVELDSRFEAVGYRGVTLDSIPAADTVTGPTGGPATADGFAVSCTGAAPYCTFYRPGPPQHAAPLTTRATATVWGLGVPRLSVHANARLGFTVGGADPWPGREPTAQLLEEYAQYAAPRYTVQLGRQTVVSRLGFTGFDGGAVTLRDADRGLSLEGYGGWGLWRGSVLPVTSPAANPLGEFRPPERTLVAGAEAGWTSSRVDVGVVYQREVDPSVDYFVSERAGATAAVRPYPGVTLSGGVDYDLAQGWWGSAEATLAYRAPSGRVSGAATVRRYRPYFDLWTIWGAFSPVPYTAFDGSLAVTPLRRLQVRVSGEHYKFASTETSTPLVSVESSGWRFSWDATYTLAPAVALQGGYHAEFGPGASSRGFDGAVSYRRGERLALGLQGATLDRPLEYRFDDSSLLVYGLYARYHPSSNMRLELDASRYAEDRKRPDAAAFDWNELRVSARVVFALSSGAELRGLPPAVRRMPVGPGGAP